MPEYLPVPLRRWSLGAAAACLLPLLLQIPGGLALGLVVVAAIGAWSPRPWPWPLRLAVLGGLGGYVLVTHGFQPGRDTGCALLASLLALKTMETRTLRDAHSLLGFSLFAPFATFLQDRGPGSLALAVPAVAAVLLVLAMLAEFRPGQPAPRGVRTRWRALGGAVLLAVPLALAGFWLFPRLASPLWGMPENALGRGGLSGHMTPDQWVELFADDGPVLRATFAGEEPRRADLYWRAQVLSAFDGRTWEPGFEPSPGPAIAAPVSPVLTYRIALEPTDRRYLVTLDWPLGAPSTGRIRGDGTVAVEAPVSSLVEYTGEAAASVRHPGALPIPEQMRQLALPPGLNPRTVALARRWREESGGDPPAIVRRALEWIGRDFSYSLTVPPSGLHAVDDFLFETRVGFCQHFSSAFATLMRAAGVPARVVIGYMGGYRNPYGGHWLVRRMDAHAWTEVWIEGRGWVRVDPTAAVAPERVLDTVQDLARREALLPEAFTPLRDLADWARRNWNDLLLGFNADRQARLLRPLGIERAGALQLAGAFAFGAALALTVTLWVMLRGRRGPQDPLQAAWRRFGRRLRRAGLARAPWEPPLGFGERAAAAFPAQAGPLRSLSRRYADGRYARAELPATERDRLIRDLDAFRLMSRSR